MEFPNKKYKTIYADPPWNEQGSGKIKRGADKHYSNIADKNCWLFLWVTNNFLKDGLEVMEAWGFRYVTNFVWCKERFGLGYYFRGQHELCLFGVKGTLKPIKRNVRSVLWAEKGKHSKKPVEARHLIEKMTYEPRIELFAREQIKGWDVWGNEAN